MSRQQVIVQPGNPAYRLDGKDDWSVERVDIAAPEYDGRNWNAVAFMLRDSCRNVTIRDFTATRLYKGFLLELPSGAVANQVRITNGIINEMYATHAGRHAAGMFTKSAFTTDSEGMRSTAHFHGCEVDGVLFHRCGTGPWGHGAVIDANIYATHNDHGWYGSRANPGGWTCRNSIFAYNGYNGGTWRGGTVEWCIFVGNYVAGSMKSGGTVRNCLTFIDSVNGCGHNVYKDRRNPAAGLPVQLTPTDQYALNGVRPADADTNVVLDLAKQGDWPTAMHNFNIDQLVQVAIDIGPMWSQQIDVQALIRHAQGTAAPPAPPAPPSEPDTGTLPLERRVQELERWRQGHIAYDHVHPLLRDVVRIADARIAAAQVSVTLTPGGAT